MSEEDRLKGSFLFDVLVVESLGGGGLSGAPLGGGCRAGVTLPFTGLGGSLGGPRTVPPICPAWSDSKSLVLSTLLGFPDTVL